ncbi:MAG: NAD(P)-binding protein, partial [Candidatus Heimdallarchaeaceae archaeon]
MTTERIYDYIIVGSGPGGATVAKELAETKKKVLVIEYGPRFTEKGEIKVINKVFLDKERKLLSSDGGIWIGRARILGGSSYVAMGNAVTPPDSILKEWG